MTMRKKNATQPTAVKPTVKRVVPPTPQAGSPPSIDAIRLHAYMKWLTAGKPDGDDLKFWLEAERELSERS